MSTKQIGNEGEERVAKFLKSERYKILDRNWRNRWCEIDIVAAKQKVIYFVEVKYRTNTTWGDGFDAVDRHKLERMARAAEAWMMNHHSDCAYELCVAAVDQDSVEIRSVV